MEKNKQYHPVTAVGEVTMGCKHCGSSYSKLFVYELTTVEAFAVIDQLIARDLSNGKMETSFLI